MQGFLQEVGSALAKDAPSLTALELARQMNVADGPLESPWPKNVGLLFFNEAPERFFPGVQIDVLWFPEGAGGARFEEKIFTGPLARMTREALAYIQRNYLRETVIKHPDRAEATRVWNFPYPALEEGLVNAVYHRSYEMREPIEVRISQEELVILSFPGPDRSIQLADLQAGRAVGRRYRNRRIGEFLKELDLTEGRSTGIPKILKEMAANGSPVPLFESDEERTWFIIRMPVHLSATRENLLTAHETAQDTAQVTAQDTAHETEHETEHETAHETEHETEHETKQVVVDTPLQVIAHSTSQVTAEVKRLLLVLTGEMSRPQLLQALELTHRENFRSVYLKPALEAGLIEMTLPNKLKSRNQRYRLSAFGKRWLEQHSGTGAV